MRGHLILMCLGIQHQPFLQKKGVYYTVILLVNQNCNLRINKIIINKNSRSNSNYNRDIGFIYFLHTNRLSIKRFHLILCLCQE